MNYCEICGESKLVNIEAHYKKMHGVTYKGSTNVVEEIKPILNMLVKEMMPVVENFKKEYVPLDKSVKDEIVAKVEKRLADFIISFDIETSIPRICFEEEEFVLEEVF